MLILFLHKCYYIILAEIGINILYNVIVRVRLIYCYCKGSFNILKCSVYKSFIFFQFPSNRYVCIRIVYLYFKKCIPKFTSVSGSFNPSLNKQKTLNKQKHTVVYFIPMFLPFKSI